MAGDHYQWDERTANGSGFLWPFLRNLVILVAVCGLAAWALSYRSEVSQSLRGALGIERGTAEATSEATGSAAADDAAINRELTIWKAPGGHFEVHAYVNGARIRFLIDTGASMVVLSKADARRADINLSRLDYTIEFQSANGIVRGAPVTLRDVSIGQLELRDVEASVNEGAMGVSLLGMTFLSRLSGYSVRGDRLILEW